jgi:hypothetical protein
MAETWSKKEREKKKRQAKKDKAEKRQYKKEQGPADSSLESMIAYVDEDGNLSDTPPEPPKKTVKNIQPSAPKL